MWLLEKLYACWTVVQENMLDMDTYLYLANNYAFLAEYRENLFRHLSKAWELGEHYHAWVLCNYLADETLGVELGKFFSLF